MSELESTVGEATDSGTTQALDRTILASKRTSVVMVPPFSGCIALVGLWQIW